MPLETLISRKILDGAKDPSRALEMLEDGGLSGAQQEEALVRMTNQNRQSVVSLVEVLNRFSGADRTLMVDTALEIIDSEVEFVPLKLALLMERNPVKGADVYQSAGSLVQTLAELSVLGVNPSDFILDRD